MKKSSILTITTGQEVYNKGISKIQVFVPNSTQTQVGPTAVPIGGANYLPGKPISILQNPPRINAVSGEPEEQCGSWSTRVVEIQDGVIIQVFGQRRARWNSVMSSANAYLRIRSDAAERYLSLKTLQVPGLSSKNQVGILGRFDIITPETARALGVVTAPMYLKTFDPVRFGFLFTDEIKTEEIAAAQRAVETVGVDSDTGVERKVAIMRDIPLVEM